MVRHRFRGLRHALHELLVADVPLVALAGRGVDHGLAGLPVRAADADVLVGAAEAALHVALEMGEGQQGVVVCQRPAHGHLCEPFPPGHREEDSPLRVHNIHRGKGPAVDAQGFPVLFRGVPVPGIVGIGLNNGPVGQPVRHKGLDPVPGDDVGAVLLPGVELHGHPALQGALDAPADVYQASRRQIAGKVYRRLSAGALFIGDIVVPACAGNCLLCRHLRYLSFLFIYMWVMKVSWHIIILGVHFRSRGKCGIFRPAIFRPANYPFRFAKQGLGCMLNFCLFFLCAGVVLSPEI